VERDGVAVVVEGAYAQPEPNAAPIEVAAVEETQLERYTEPIKAQTEVVKKEPAKAALNPVVPAKQTAMKDDSSDPALLPILASGGVGLLLLLGWYAIRRRRK